MKKLLTLLLCLAAVLMLAACSRSGDNTNKEKLDSLFDNRTGQTSEDIPDTPPSPPANSTAPSGSSNASSDGKDNNAASGKDSVKTPDNPDSKDTSGESSEKPSHGEEEKKPDLPFSHTDAEKQQIISRYRDAENFYYDMIFQNFELDNMDTVTLKADGYETEYHRVILEDVNSLADLKALYSNYFTNSFIAFADFSAYCEENGKLYCAATAGAAGTGSGGYTCTVESIDAGNAVVVRRLSDGGGAQRIAAVKVGELWYFDGVAVR